MVKLLVLYFFLKEKVNPSPENKNKLSLIDKVFYILLS
jgi:hypothetical protein